MLRVLATIAAVCASAQRAHESGTLRVTSPKALVDQYTATDGQITMKPALFGVEGYKHQASLSGKAVYIPADDSEGCAPINIEELNLPPDEVIILVVERGNCTFVTKVKHAQDAHAAGCVIVDNKPEPGLPFMADDNTGTVITIPSVLIHMDDGKLLNASISNGETVWLTMSWNLPHPDNIVEWELWTTANDKKTFSFKRDFDNAAAVLGKSAVMTPHYFIGDGQRYNNCYQLDPNKPLPCGTDCTNSGRYCPHGGFYAEDAQATATGAQVIEENLRQICIFNVLKAKDQSDVPWWNYVEIFNNNCKTFTKACAELTLADPTVAVSAADVNACMTAAGGIGPRDGVNTLLADQIRLRRDMGIYIEPTILINGAFYHGGLQCNQPIDRTTCNVLEGICLGFLDERQIPACLSSPDCELGLKKDKCGVCGGAGEMDACGRCLETSSSSFNSTCMGCDNVPNSGLKNDVCMVCNGKGLDACGHCHKGDPESWVVDKANCPTDPPSTMAPTGVDEAAADPATGGSGAGGLAPGTAVAIIVPSIIVAGILAFLFARHRQRMMRDDVDALLRQYLPMADKSGETTA